ncbi:hypothetical protein ENUP19_0062G0022 [Entamoeba nuttalli]|uniref:Kinase n=2 Tax=Entamoeba nuttalli TaxID=412467 RepID=K2H6A7_ENTNP|nr:inositol polyphosphate kinase, putative [Entamoeba nuttalli P19]EKE38029.1 inositol polyphosphate kinase, putative [Entamoeba nuttalli P19]|eukprot:XP_008859634.1 inositol polyphosphate kinase, putative [Entamoeba nuttalli P19]
MSISTTKSEWIQAGGHGGSHQLVPNGEYLLKPCLAPREKAFYLKVQNDKEWCETEIIPKFYGIEEHDFGYGEFEFIKMENLMNQIKKPFVLDLKIGTQTWDPETSSKKMKKRLVVDSTSTTTSLGVRFSGMRRNVTDKPTLYSRYLCTNEVNTRDSLKEYIKLYFFDGEKYRNDLLPYFIQSISKMIDVMNKKQFKMFSASVLFVYDGARKFEDQKHACKIIDFAHAWDVTEEECNVDDGFVIGLTTLKIMLEELHSEFNLL